MSRMTRPSLAALAASVLLLTGCPGVPTVILEPIQRPPGIAARVEGEVERTALALNGGNLLVSLVKAGSGERIANASLSLIGPTLGSATIRQTTDVAFYPLIPGSYQLRVSAPGYKTQVEGNITLDAKQTLERKIELVPEGGTLTGTVTANGQPVWGARVLSGDAWTFTGQDGMFSLSGVAAGAGKLSIRKGGFQGLDQSVTVNGAGSVGTLSLSALGGDRTVALVNPTDSFGGGAQTVGSEFKAFLDGLNNGLARASSLGTAQVRLLVSPRLTSAGVGADAAATQAWVAGGGTLIVTGEWGGFGEYDPEAINKLTRPFGLAVRPDLVRIAGQTTQSEWVSATLNPTLPASRGASGLKLYTGCSVMASPMAMAIASSGTSGYRVQAVNTGDQTLAAAVPYGDGLVVLVGDTSAWVGNHLNEAGNRQFMLNLFGW
ncbi:PEGA domain protein [compost metagenome]